ncbi:MAG TPA: hypothetical protein VGH39_06160 [Xanthobacteraceae bacterium]|jgi:hypothetical protein
MVTRGSIDLKTFVNAAALAGTLIVVFATVSADLNAADIDKAVREHQAVVTDLSANASAITYWVRKSDRWHAVPTVATEIRSAWRREKSCPGPFLVGAFTGPVPADLGPLCQWRAATSFADPS